MGIYPLKYVSKYVSKFKKYLDETCNMLQFWYICIKHVVLLFQWNER